MSLRQKSGYSLQMLWMISELQAQQAVIFNLIAHVELIISNWESNRYKCKFLQIICVHVCKNMLRYDLGQRQLERIQLFTVPPYYPYKFN